jgi:hypothetical protein
MATRFDDAAAWANAKEMTGPTANSQSLNLFASNPSSTTPTYKNNATSFTSFLYTPFIPPLCGVGHYLMVII